MVLNDPNNDGIVTPGELAGPRPSMIAEVQVGPGYSFYKVEALLDTRRNRSLTQTYVVSDILVVDPGLTYGFSNSSVNLQEINGTVEYPDDVIAENGSSTTYKGVFLQVSVELLNLSNPNAEIARLRTAYPSEAGKLGLLAQLPDPHAAMPFEAGYSPEPLTWWQPETPTQLDNSGQTLPLVLHRTTTVLFDAFYE